MARIAGFVRDTQTNIVKFLELVDNWSSLQQENVAMDYYNGVTQADLDAFFGTTGGQPNVTKVQYQAALTAFQAQVDSAHVLATAQKLYKLKT